MDVALAGVALCAAMLSRGVRMDSKSSAKDDLSEREGVSTWLLTPYGCFARRDSEGRDTKAGLRVDAAVSVSADPWLRRCIG